MAAKKTYTWPSGSKGHSISWADQRAKAAKPAAGGGKFAWPSAPSAKTHTRSWEAEQQRIKTAKLAKPIVAGSAITEGQLARETKAAGDVAYGARQLAEQQGLGAEQARARDTGSFYDQYQAQVAQHAQNVRDIGAAAAAAGAGLQQGVTGLAAADLTQLNQRATADAAARGATPGDLAQMASNAAAVRQALVGSFTAQQNAANAASSKYASNLADVVVPGQKLQGLAQGAGEVRKAQQQIEATAGERGAKELLYGTERRTAEQNQILAEQVATGKSAADLAKAKLQSQTSIKTANIRADTATQKLAADATQKQATADAKAAADANKAHQPNKYGVPADQWARWSTSHRQREIAKWDAKHGKGKTGAGGVTYLPKGQAAAGLTQLTGLKLYANKAKTGEPFVQGHGKQPPAKSRDAVAQKVSNQFRQSLKHPALLRAAVDAAWDKHLSPTTQAQLHAAGYSVKDVSSALGVPTHEAWVKTHRGSPVSANTKAYGQGGGNLGGSQHS